MLLGLGSVVLKYFTNVNDFAVAVWLKIIISLVWVSGHAVATESCQGPATSLKIVRRVVVAPVNVKLVVLVFCFRKAAQNPEQSNQADVTVYLFIEQNG